MDKKEKDAIDFFKKSLKKKMPPYWYHDTLFNIEKRLKIILNLTEKQQKEIENYQILKDDIEGHRIVYVDTPEFEEKYISKDKIREKLKKSKKEYEHYEKENLENLMRMTAGEIVMLEELLGE